MPLVRACHILRWRIEVVVPAFEPASEQPVFVVEVVFVTDHQDVPKVLDVDSEHYRL